MKQLFRKCPVCLSERGKVLGEVNMALNSTLNLPACYDIVVCDKCGFAFADTPSTQDDYNAYYSSDNCYADEGEVKKNAKQQSVKAIADFIEKFVEKDESVIDIGCGSGDLLLELKNRGYINVCGVDPSPKSIEVIKKKGIKGKVANAFDKVNEDIEKSDVVISTCVMEHICDLNGFIEAIKGYIKDKGKLLIVVPAVEGFGKYYQSKPNYFNHEHINYFSKQSLINLLGANGFESLTDDGEFYEVRLSNDVADVMIENIFLLNMNNTYAIKEDQVSEKIISEYLEKAKCEEERIKELINIIENKYEKCIVWGAGSMAMQLMSERCFAEKVLFIVDNNIQKWGKDIAGIQINNPDILLEKDNPKVPIVILCMQYSDAIIRQIREMKIENEIIVCN